MNRLLAFLVLALILAGGTGFLTATALSTGQQAARTVTINVATGPTGPTGPAGPAGATTCPDGFSPGDLVINHPGGQVTLYTCLKD